MAATACSPVNAPDPRTPNIPAPQTVEERRKALNEANDSIMIVPLEADVLVPRFTGDEPLPGGNIGPLQFRGETLANALDLILADRNIPVAFETNEGLKRRVTVSNLSGSVDKVVDRLCGLANLYCAYDDGVLVVRDTQTFTVAMPPISSDSGSSSGSGGIGGSSSDSGSSGSSGGGLSDSGSSGGDGGDDEVMDNIASGLRAITKTEVSSDPTTRTLIYTATQRTARAAEQYFQRLRASTALIIYETYIWEVQLNNANATGIRWQQLGSLGAFNLGLNAGSGTLSNVVTGTPISIGLPTRGEVDLTTGDVFRFLSEQGSVKTISQPQITVLSGSRARMRVAETRNYVSELTRTVTDNGQESVSTSTDQVDSGFTLDIQSNWDQSTVYGRVQIALEEFLGFEDFEAGTNGTLSLPRTSSRQVDTQVRVRPGDSILIAGLVREQDQFDKSGPGFNQPIIPTSRSTSTANSELVFLLRPRVIVYKSPDPEDIKKAAEGLPADLSTFIYDPSTTPQTDLPLGTVKSDTLDPSTAPAVKKETIKKEPKPVDKDWRK